MTARYYGKIYRKEKPTLIEYFGYGFAGALVGYIIPYVIDDGVLSCHILSVICFCISGLLIAIFHSVWNIPIFKSNIILIVVFSLSLLLVSILCGG